MSDMISRQTAISAICNACGKIDCDKMDKCEKLQLPPANSSEFPNSSDTICRQAAIRWVKTECNPYGKPTLEFESGKRVIEHLKQMPSAQPEIIRCKDCEYGEQDEVGRWFCRSLGCQIGNEDGSGYCADALNRKEGAKDD